MRIGRHAEQQDQRLERQHCERRVAARARHSDEGDQISNQIGDNREQSAGTLALRGADKGVQARPNLARCGDASGTVLAKSEKTETEKYILPR